MIAESYWNVLCQVTHIGLEDIGIRPIPFGRDSLVVANFITVVI